jgi:hypothetical protein
MATVQAPRPRAKFDALLEAHIEHARGRVRTSDLLTGSLGLLCLVLAFGVGMVLADRWFVLADGIRQVALVAFLGAVGWYAFRVFARPLLQTVNPYYAARQVEQTIPEAKNSIITWLDLRGEQLAPTVRDAVTRKAAEDLGYANVEQAVSDRRLSLFGVAAAGLAALALALMLLLRPAPFFSLLSRAFLPFGGTAIARQTDLTILEPAGGDATVPIHQSVVFRVDVGGRVPKAEDADAVRLRLRYNPDDGVWEEKRFEVTDKVRSWTLRLPSAQVRTGFEYQVVGGDAETPVYKIGVKAKPLVTDFEVRYRYRPYLRFQDDVRTDPNLQAVRGTEVIILAKTNRAVGGGVLRLTPAGGEALPEIAAERLTDRPDTLKYVLTLERDGQYRLQFKAGDGEPSDETLPYEVRVLPDNPPALDWTRPAPEKLPLNGTLAVGANVTDDFGLTRARLRLRYKASPESPHVDLPHVEHQAGRPLAGADGVHPRALPLAEVVALETLTDAGGMKLRPQPGAVIEYYFEAEDNFDFPKPQVGRSEIRAVTLADAQDERQRDAEREAARNEKNQNDAQQPPPPGQEKGQPNAGEKPEQGEKQPGEGQPQDGGGQDNPPPDQETLEKAQKLADALKKQQAGEGANNADPNQPRPDDKKPDGQQKPGDQPQDEQQPGSDPKGDKSGGQAKSKSGDKQPGPEQQPDKRDGDPHDAGKPDGARPQAGGDEKPNRQPGDANQPQQGPDGKPGDQPDRPRPTGDKSSAPKDQPQPGDKNANQGDKPNDGSKSGDLLPQPAGPRPEQQPDGKAPAPPNPSATRPDGQSKPSNPDGSKPQGNQPANPGMQTPENKSGEKTDKSGEKPGAGPTDKPSDQKPQTSPDKGNAEGGKQGAQRAGADPKSKDKAEKSDDKAKSGQSDPTAPKPEGNQGDTAPSNPGQPKGNQPPAQPDGGQPGKPDAHAPKSSDMQDAAKPHDKPGEAPSAKPKSDGTPSQPAPGDKKPEGDPSQTKLPADVQKMVDDFQKADDATKKQIMQKLEEMAKSAPTEQKRQAAEQGAKICNGDCDNPNGIGGQPKADGKSDGQGDKANPGQGSNPKAGKAGGDKPGEGPSKDKPGQGEPNAGDKPGEKTDPAAGKQPKADGGKGEAGAPNANESVDGEPKDADGPASVPGSARGQRSGAGDIRTGTGGPPKAPNEEFLRKSGDLQLDDFRKRVDKNVLDQVKMTEAEYQEFLKAYESLVKRAKSSTPEPADRVRGAVKGGSAANAAARKVAPGEKSGPKTERGGRGVAPPEFREQYKETTEQQSKQKPAGR